MQVGRRALAAAGAVATAFALTRFRFVPGTDAYAYVLQARILAEQHRVQIHDGAVVVHAFDAAVGSLVGYEHAVCLLIGVAAFLPLATTRGTIAAVYACASPAMWWCAVEYPRQALACALLPLWLHAWRRRGAWLLAPLASAACHRMFFAAAVGFVIAALVPNKIVRAVVVVAAVAIVAIGLAARDDVAGRLVFVLPYVGLIVVDALDRVRRSVALLVPVVVASVVASVVARPFAHPDTRGTGRDLDEEQRAVAFIDANVPHDDLIVARRKLAFLYTATTTRDAFLFDPDASHGDPQRIFRAVHSVAVAELATQLPARCAYGDPNVAVHVPDTAYSIVREDCYEEMRAAAAADRDNPGLFTVLHNSAENPWQPRPSFLPRGSP